MATHRITCMWHVCAEITLIESFSFDKQTNKTTKNPESKALEQNKPIFLTYEQKHEMIEANEEKTDTKIQQKNYRNNEIKRTKSKTVKNIVVTINIKRQEKMTSGRCFVFVVLITSANVNVVLAH